MIESVTTVRPAAAQSENLPPDDFALSLAGAIRRSQGYLLSEQKPEGYWVGELLVDSTLVSDTVAYHHWNGQVDPEWQRKAVNHIFNAQLPEGGWNIYYGGPSEVNATIKAYLALKLAGVPVTDPRMLKAREVALNLGGVPRMNTISKLYLALIGLYPWEYVPTIPCEVLLIGKWFHVNFWDMSNWSRGMLVPLAIINHFKPTRPVKVDLDELYPEGIHERDLALAPDPEKVSWRNFFLWLDRLHKLAEWFAEHSVHPFRKTALKRCENWMLERFEGSDGLAAIFPAMLNALIALKALGYPDDHPQVKDALAYVKSQQEDDGSWYGRWGVNYIYGTWQVLRGMRAMNLDMQEDWLQRGRAWLESVQHEDGGWGERCNTYDDPVFKGRGPSTASQTAWAVMGLCAFDDPENPFLKRGIEYLCRTQNPEGSWTEHETTGTGFPKVFYLKYDMYRNAWPLLALATYKQISDRAAAKRNGK